MNFLFKGFEHVFKALKHMYKGLGQVFQVLEHKFPLGGKDFSFRLKEK